MLLLTDLIAQRLRVGSHIKAPLSHPGLRIARATFRAAYDSVRTAPRHLKALYHAMGWAFPTGLCCFIIGISGTMQKETANGELVTIDDDSMYGTDRPHVTRTYNWIIYAMVLLFALDVQVAARVGKGCERLTFLQGSLCISLESCSCPYSEVSQALYELGSLGDHLSSRSLEGWMGFS